MAKLKAILVDDEQDSREILANYLSKYCQDVILLDKCDSVKTALASIDKHQPEIVFLDIEMPYGNGFDLLDQVKEVNFETIFVTAYDNYAIKALNQSAAYYLLKPIDIEELITAVEKIKIERINKDYIEHSKILIDNIRNQSVHPAKLMLPTLEGFEIVETNEILYCEADNNLTRFYLTDGRKLLICRTLKYFDDILGGHQFFRIHRSYLINIDYVIRYTKGKGGFITLKNQRQLEVSPKKKAQFLQAFQN
jgi:two-component system LytT family response regulator